MSDVTRVLSQIEAGDQAAAAQLLPLVYDQLRKLAAEKLRHESPGQTLQATALVHEAYVRLVDTPQTVPWTGRRHFFAAAALCMRRILVDRARRKRRSRHGGEFNRIPLDDGPIESAADGVDLLDLDQALSRFGEEHPDHAEVVQLRYFAGLTHDEVAAMLGVSIETVHRRWRFARAWLHRAIDGPRGAEDGRRRDG
ncbi:MAG: sigma-70 family RNA polymerase sigma factor [Planctomycetaceae bacterium]|nr:sigma-70 family RNA polymerase sigma factor [Planctomycetaceae bacterium]